MLAPTLYRHEKKAEGYGLKFWCADSLAIERIIQTVNEKYLGGKKRPHKSGRLEKIQALSSRFPPIRAAAAASNLYQSPAYLWPDYRPVN